MKVKEYNIEYIDENNFRAKERAVRKYNMLAYKELTFKCYPKLEAGEFFGKEAGNSDDGGVNYEIALPTDNMFAKIHGVLTLHYTVYKDKKSILLTNITPEDILLEGADNDLTAYKGVMVSKSRKETDIFKINLLNMMRKG